MMTEDKLERAFDFLLAGNFAFYEDRSWIDCKAIYCAECPLMFENNTGCLMGEFLNYLKENYEELIA